MTSFADPRRFLYRDNALDPEGALRLTAEALKGCDDGELYLQYMAAESFGFDDGRLKTADFNTQAGFGLRGVSGETTAFAHANDISEGAIRRAAETMALLDPARQPLAAPPRRTNAALYTNQDPLGLIPFARKVALCQEVDAAARARDPRVSQVSVSLLGSWSVIEIVRPDGFVAFDVRPLVRLNVSIVVEQNGRRESGYFGTGGRFLYDSLFEPERWNRVVDQALAQALINLESVAAPAGEMTVVLGPGWPGVLLHEAIGHGLEGDFNRKGTSTFSGRIGERVAAPGVTVVDDGAIHDRRGSLTIDDEGTPTQANVLIEDGILKGYLQDRLNARLMGRARYGQRPPRKLRPRADAAHDQHLHACGARRSGRDPGACEERHLRQEFRRRAGGHHQRQVRLFLHRGLPHRKRPRRRADQGRHADRRRPLLAHQDPRDRQRSGAGRGRRHLRQGRPVGPLRRGPADAADRGADGGRDGLRSTRLPN